jgi:hypothetical protein
MSRINRSILQVRTCVFCGSDYYGGENVGLYDCKFHWDNDYPIFPTTKWILKCCGLNRSDDRFYKDKAAAGISNMLSLKGGCTGIDHCPFDLVGLMKEDMEEAMRWFVQILPLTLRDDIVAPRDDSILATIRKQEDIPLYFQIDMPFGKQSINVKERYDILWREETGYDDGDIPARRQGIYDRYMQLDTSTFGADDIFESMEEQDDFSRKLEFIPFMIVKRIK